MQVFSKIDIGKTRASNQDAYIVESLDSDTVLIVVCDGMGGANAGNVASETAVNTISRYIKSSYNARFDNYKLSELLVNAITSANIELFDMATSNPQFEGMGTTVVSAIIKGDTAIICNVGDSRAYLVNSELFQITKDHSMVQSLVESGKLTPEEARFHPRKNIITKALGTEDSVVPDCFEQKLNAGDTVLFCTDGLTNFIEHDNILDIFKNNDISKVADILVDTANSNGGGDNITVVIAAV